jgi:hypothetical protein
MRSWLVALSFFAMAAAHGSGLAAQESPARGPAGNEAPAAPVVDAPAGFIIGPEDVLSIVFWRDKEMSTTACRRISRGSGGRRTVSTGSTNMCFRTRPARATR